MRRPGAETACPGAARVGRLPHVRRPHDLRLHAAASWSHRPFCSVPAWIGVSLVAALVAATPIARAAPPASTPELAAARERALEVFKQGRTAYKAGDYDAALKLFRQAQGIYQHEPLIILALAKTLDRAGDLERALQYFRLFLQEAAAEDPDRAAAVARIRAIEKELAERPAVLVLGGLPSAAEVFVDGKLSGVDHRGAVKLPAGEHKIEVRMRDRLPFHRAVVLSAGQETRIDVVLLEPVDRSKLPRDHTWTWVAGGATAAAGLAAGVLALRGSGLRTDYFELFNASGRATATGRSRFGCAATATKDEDCPKLIAEGVRLREAIDSNDTWVASVGIATGALALGTAIAWFAAPVREVGGGNVTVVPLATGADAGLTLGWRF